MDDLNRPAYLLAPIRGDHADWDQAQPIPGPITPRQIAVLEYVADHVADYGYPPSLREIAVAVGLASPSTANYQVGELRAMGLLAHPGKHAQPRSLRLVQPGEVA